MTERVTAEQLRADGEAILSETGIDGDTHPNWAIGKNILRGAAEIDRLAAEVERLREVLRSIADDEVAEAMDAINTIHNTLRHRQQPQDVTFHRGQKALRDADRKARAALETNQTADPRPTERGGTDR